MNTRRWLVAVLVGMSVLVVWSSQVAIWQMRPSFFHEYHQIAEEIYTRYLTDGTLPAPSTLSPSAQKLLSENKGITYSVTDGLGYEYDKPYPVNPPLIGFVTFGLCWGGTVVNVGESQSPENIIHNAKLRADKLP